MCVGVDQNIITSNFVCFGWRAKTMQNIGFGEGFFRLRQQNKEAFFGSCVSVKARLDMKKGINMP